MQSLARWVSTTCAVGALTLAVVSPLAAQAKPVSATAQCKDGSYSEAKTERGACSGHGGVGTWYGAPKAEAKAATKGAGTAAKDAGKAVKDESKAIGSAASAGAKTVATDTKAAAGAATATTKTAAVTPAGSTGQCQDGTYTTAKSQRGACSGHGGVATWLADAPNATTPASAGTRATAPAAANPPAAAPTTPASAPKAGNIQNPPADARPNATAQCNDGTFSMAKQHSGACSGHKGLKTWFK